MPESSTFLATLAEMARRIVLRQGRNRFGRPPRKILAALKAIEDPDIMEDLALRLLDVSSWEQLMPNAAEASKPDPLAFEQVRRELLNYAAKTKTRLKMSELYDLFPERP